MQFLQSMLDFPQMVKLGDKMPSFGLHRFKQGLRFVPTDDEGFILRGDKQRLTYKGRRRSHRFTILGDTAFEYDCILNREPESNVICLRIEGAEHFDFFRQPDFVKNPFLKGSYAVYKKETLIGEGTGKLCHIHRPEIIDAHGRRCWGTLAIVGNELHITIPEQWLADAKYPVVVDPTLGTTTIGSLEYYKTGDFYDEEEDEWYEGSSSLWANDSLELDKVLITENVGNIGTFYIYKNGDLYKQRIKRSYPCMYDNINNLPKNRISVNECEIIDPFGYEGSGWLQANFSKNCPINAGDYIWFGLRGHLLKMRFDYGGVHERVSVWEAYYYQGEMIPNVINNSNSEFRTTQYTREIKVSMYFTYEALAQNYVKTLTQGIKITDTRKIKTDYKRTATQTLKVTTVISKVQTFIRQCLITVSNTMRVERMRGFLRFVSDKAGLFEGVNRKWGIKRKCADTAGIQWHKEQKQSFLRKLKDNDNVNDCRKLTADYLRETYQTVKGYATANAFVSFFRQCLMIVSNTMRLGQIQLFLRSVFDFTGIQEEFHNRREIARKCKENAEVSGEVKRSKGFIREIFDNLTGTDNSDFNILFVRTVNETQGINDSLKNFSEYIRGLYFEAGSVAETAHIGTYYRKESDRVQAEGLVLRRLFIFLRILTKTIVRDYIIGRFLIAREELKLKSCVVREIVLESKIN